MNPISLSAIVMASITLFVGAGHLAIYLRRRRSMVNLTFGLLCLSIGAYSATSAGVHDATSPGAMKHWLRLLFLSYCLGGIFFAWFVSFYAESRGRRVAITISIAFLPTLLAALFHIEILLWSGDPSFRDLTLPFGLSVRQHVIRAGPALLYMIAPSIAVCAYAIHLGVRLRDKGERNRGRLMVAATVIFLSGGLSDAMVMIGVYDFIFVFKFTFLAFIMLMAYSLGRELLEAAEIREALTKSEERLELALEGANDALWDWSPATGEVHFSPRYFGMLGYGPDAMPHSYETWVKLLHPEDREKSEAFVRSFIESGDEFFSMEFRMKARDGGWRWVLSRGKAVERDEAGRVIRMVGTHADITPMKDAEAAVAESEERFRSIVQSSPMGMLLYELRPDNRLVLVDTNQAADFFTGIETRPLIGMTIEEAFPQLAETQVPDIYRRAARDGTPWEIRDLRYADDRIQGAFDVHAFQTSPGRMAVLFLDVTDRLRAEQSLKTSEAMYRSYFLLGLIGMAVTTEERDWVEINPHLTEILGYELEEIRNLSWAKLSHPDDLVSDEEAYRRLVSGEIDEYSMEKRFLNRDGSVVYTDLSVTCVRQDDGTVDFVIAHVQDVTERKQAEEWLRQSQKMEAVGQLAGGVAHDFNNLLQAIQGYTDVALGQLPREHGARENMREVKRAAERAATLTRQLLTFSRQETLQPAHLNLNDVVTDLLKILRRVIGEQIELVVHAQPRLRRVLADPGQMEQVILNLCINARDAMPEGGRVSIETGNVVLDEEFMREHPWATEPEHVLLRVTDTGEGIPVEIQDRIFEPFYTTKEVGQGTGLGLATVYAIVQQHLGGIVVESAPGEGATFSIYLPPDRQPEKEGPEEDDVPDAAGGTETVLLAEDDDAVRSLVVSVLEEKGYRLFVARDGEEAIRLFHERADEIDIALVDVIMPKKSGRDVFNAVKASHPEVPVLFTTGYSFRTLERDKLPVESAQLIQKPYAPRELLIRMREALDNRAATT